MIVEFFEHLNPRSISLDHQTAYGSHADSSLIETIGGGANYAGLEPRATGTGLEAHATLGGKLVAPASCR